LKDALRIDCKLLLKAYSIKVQTHGQEDSSVLAEVLGQGVMSNLVRQVIYLGPMTHNEASLEDSSWE
jgi:hypothetical protein